MSKNFKDKFHSLYKEKCSEFPYQPNKLPPVERIIVIGDIHGDLNLVYKNLKLAKVIDKNNKWTKNPKYSKTVVVQLGDQIDSCRPNEYSFCDNKDYLKEDSADDLQILKYFTNLHEQASKSGGAVYSILGNHELMNVNGNTSYVSYKNLHDPYFKKKEFKFEDPLLARKYAFSPGNNIANFLACTRKTALIIGNNLFVHAGILPKIAKKYNVDDINYILSLYLFKELQNKNDYNDILNSPVNSPLWTRQFSHDPGEKTCDNILLPLKSVYKVDNMYVGHNPQLGNGIKSMCNDKIWLTDIGNSSAFKMFHTTESFKNIEILEILTDLDTHDQKFNILKGKK